MRSIIVLITLLLACAINMSNAQQPILSFSPASTRSVGAESSLNGVTLTSTTTKGCALKVIVNIQQIIDPDQVATLFALTANNNGAVSLELLDGGLSLHIDDGMTSHRYSLSISNTPFPLNHDVDVVITLDPVGMGGSWVSVYLDGQQTLRSLTQITPTSMTYQHIQYQSNIRGTTTLIQLYDSFVSEQQIKQLPKQPNTEQTPIDVHVPNTAATTPNAMLALISTCIALFTLL